MAQLGEQHVVNARTLAAYQAKHAFCAQLRIVRAGLLGKSLKGAVPLLDPIKSRATLKYLRWLSNTNLIQSTLTRPWHNWIARSPPKGQVAGSIPAGRATSCLFVRGIPA